MNKAYKIFLPNQAAQAMLGQTGQRIFYAMGGHKDPRCFENEEDYNLPLYHYRRLAPGKLARIKRKEQSRQLDRERVHDIIAMILAKDRVKRPPESLKDLKIAMKAK